MAQLLMQALRPRRPRGCKSYEVVEDRKDDENTEASEKAMVKEVVKPNVDAEARWIKKRGKLHFGYKRHTVTDENGMVLAEKTTAADESDIKHLETPLKKAKLPRKALVYADKGYDSTENKETLKRMGLKAASCIREQEDMRLAKDSRGSIAL